MSHGGHRRFISTLMNAYGFEGALNRVGFVWTSFFTLTGLKYNIYKDCFGIYTKMSSEKALLAGRFILLFKSL